MNLTDVQGRLRASLAEMPLSRSERGELKAALAPLVEDAADVATARREAFSLAQQAIMHENARADHVLDWLEDCVKVLQSLHDPGPTVRTDAFFSPGDDCRSAIVAALRNARRSADLCVFTISDDYITRAIRQAHDRGVQVRIISDDDKSFDAGSDVMRMARAGLDVRVDRDPEHMHHKFAVFDQRVLITGSYNWTRSAAERNQENIVRTDDPQVVRDFAATFDRLWAEETRPCH